MHSDPGLTSWATIVSPCGLRNQLDKNIMVIRFKQTEKAYFQVGLGFIAVALFIAVAFLPGIREARSPSLYVIIVGGIFVGVPAAVGIGLVSGRLQRRLRKGSSRDS